MDKDLKGFITFDDVVGSTEPESLTRRITSQKIQLDSSANLDDNESKIYYEDIVKNHGNWF